MASGQSRLIVETVDPYQTSDPDHLAYQEANREIGRLTGQLRLRRVTESSAATLSRRKGGSSRTGIERLPECGV